MINPRHTSRAILRRLVLLQVQFNHNYNKSLVTRSIPEQSEERLRRSSSSRRRMSKTSDSRGGAEEVEEVTGCSLRSSSPAAFTQEDTAIHSVHREACEVRSLRHSARPRIHTFPMVSCLSNHISSDEWLQQTPVSALLMRTLQRNLFLIIV